MAHGAWRMAHGTWRVAHGAWHMAYGAWRMAHGAWGCHFLKLLVPFLCCRLRLVLRRWSRSSSRRPRWASARSRTPRRCATRSPRPTGGGARAHQHPHVAAGKGWGEAVASNRMPAPALGRRAVGGGPSGWRAYHHHKSSICREVWDVRAFREGEVAEGGGVRETWGGGTLQGVLGGHRELWGASGDSRPGLAVGSWPGLAAGDVAEG